MEKMTNKKNTIFQNKDLIKKDSSNETMVKLDDSIYINNEEEYLIERIINKILPLKDSFLYFPENEDVAIIKETNKMIEIERIIFGGNVSLSKFEEMKIYKFKEYIIKSLYESYSFKNKTNFNLKEKINFIFPEFFQFLFYFFIKENIEPNNVNAFKECIKSYFENKMNNKNTKECPYFVKVNNPEILRFLISNDFKYNQTFNDLNNNCIWRRENLPVKIIAKNNLNEKFILNRNVDLILNSGFIYLHGVDNQYRPNIVIRPEIYFELNKNKKFNFQLKDWLDSCIFILEICINFLLIQGQIENWNLIIDLNNVYLFYLPKEINKILNIIQNIYKYRLNRIYILNINHVTSILWKMVKNIFGSYIDKKFTIVNSKNNFFELFENIKKEQIEIKYGGYAKNIEFDNIEFYYNKLYYDKEDIYQNSVFNEISLEKDIKIEFYSLIEKCYLFLIQESNYNNEYLRKNSYFKDNASKIYYDELKKQADYFIVTDNFIKNRIRYVIKNLKKKYFTLLSSNNLYNDSNFEKYYLKTFSKNIKFFKFYELINVDQNINENEHQLVIQNNPKVIKSPFIDYNIINTSCLFNCDDIIKEKNFNEKIQKESFNCNEINRVKTDKKNLDKEKLHKIENSVNLYESCLEENSFSIISRRSLKNNVSKKKSKFFKNQFNSVEEKIICDDKFNSEAYILNLEASKIDKNKNNKVEFFKSPKVKNKNSDKTTNCNMISGKENNVLEESKFCKMECGEIKLQCLIF